MKPPIEFPNSSFSMKLYDPLRMVINKYHGSKMTARKHYIRECINSTSSKEDLVYPECSQFILEVDRYVSKLRQV